MGKKIGSNPKSRRKFVKAFVYGSLLCPAENTASAHQMISLVKTGKRSGLIYLSPHASPSEKWAADQLSLFVEQMTGIRLPVTDQGPISAAETAIAVGTSDVTDRLGIRAPGGESCLLKTVGETLVIAGGRQRGTMYGVFLFLERVGCRWFTSDIARIPKRQTLELAPIDEICSPAFEYREVFFTEAQGKEWSARNRLNGHFHQLDASVGGRIQYMPFAHSFYELVPPDPYFRTHPEYFALVAGKRRGEMAQLCLTNTEIVQLAVVRIGQWLGEHPDVDVVSVSQNDGGGVVRV